MARPINPVGLKSDKIWRNALSLAIHRISDDKKTKLLDRIAQRVVQAALGGDMAAVAEIGNRLDGKPTQGVDINHNGTIDIRSNAISAVDEFVAGAIGGRQSRNDTDSLPN